MNHLPENERYVLDMLAEGSELSQWDSRIRMKSWGQAMLGTDTLPLRRDQRDTVWGMG